MNARIFMISPVLLLVAAGCGTTWKGADNDGDGQSAADGDCWDAAEGPVAGITGADIYAGAKDAWYDGVDANCAGDDDFDADLDGFVPEEHVGRKTFGVDDSGALPGGDCLDSPDEGFAERLSAAASDDPFAAFAAVAGFDQPLPSAVFPGADDLLYDDVDADCAGEDADGNGAADDFDADLDGFASALMARRDGSLGDDCAEGAPGEDPDVNRAGLPLDDIFPGATDSPYDGTDADCSGVDVNDDGVLDDCDLDLDGGAFDDADDGEDDGCVIRDCDDTDATAVPDPTVAEIPYDGVDNNCLLTLDDGTPDNDGDADRDGFWAADYRDRVPSPDDTVGPLPATFDDCWDDPDALPAGWVEQPVMAFDPTADWEAASTLAWDDAVTAAATFPGALDRPYDTIDQDCAGDDVDSDGVLDDMDWDGDGYAALYQSGGDSFGDDCLDCAAACEGASGELAAICEVVCDNDAYLGLADEDNLTNRGLLDSDEVNPDALEEWGDGTDADCDRSSDFDQDKDFYAGRDYGDGEPWAFEEERVYYYSDGATLSGGGDCNDEVLAIRPGAVDAWYDGVDQNCGDNDDFDADADGYVPTTYVGRTTAHGTGTPSFGGGLPGDDCNDTDATFNPGRTDTWYDGLDNDCADNDDYDQDVDSYVQTVHGGLSTSQGAGTTPYGGALPTDDCNDTQSTVNPGRTDTWYDGVDTNCSDNDDYDADADGYVRTADVGRSTSFGSGVSTTFGGALPGDDCNDTLATVRPGLADAWYDGVDTDCSDNDDYDQDADGHVRVADSGRTTSFGTGVSTTFGGALPANDCDDTNAGVYGGATTDVWYDGIDTDCAGNDDYDVDADGYASLARAGSYGPTTYVTGSGVLPTTDCNDTVSTVNPGRTDTWYDGVDSNCGNNDDYDRDADGYVQTIHGSLSTNQGTGSASFGGALPTDDCNDTLATIKPGLTDTWYDGVDTNCSDNDDHDADADGYVPTAYVSRVTSYGAGSSLASFGGALPGDDCNDAVVSINPGATDTWYDGVDTNCSDNDDYDADADNYVPTTYVSRTTSHGAGTSTFGTLKPGDDCNDTVSTINPGRTDAWYDGIDTNCSDNDDYDADADNYVPTVYVSRTTSHGAGTSTFGTLKPGDDCNDTLSTVNPGRTDTWYDGVDSDCSDNDDYDRDLDGHVRAVDSGRTTSFGAGVSTTFGGSLPANDCDDTNATVYGGSTDTWYDGVDSDCSGNDDYDRDADGYARIGTYGPTTYVSGSGALPVTDCNDGVSTVNPGRTDTWYDGTDSNCGGNDDYDRDGDGYVQTIHGSLTTSQGSGSTAFGGALPTDDCNDTLSTIRPGLTDTWYDGVDTNCSDNDDYDRDADAYVQTIHVGLTTSYGAGSSLSAFGGALPGDDCNDTLSTIKPGLTDTWYDGVDTNCSDNDDYDRDADAYVQTIHVGLTTSYGAGSSLAAFGGALPGDDCNDTLSTIKPGLTDAWYDGVDTNCSDNDDYDQDADGYVRTADVGLVTSYGAGSSLASFGGALPGNDCNDTAAAIRPSATEVCDGGVDNDCDSLADDADPSRDSSTGTLFYRDADTDTYGNLSVTTRTCTVPSGYVTNSLDCDDASSAIKPGATEVCDDVDNDCDALVDDADPGRTLASTTTFYRDVDADTYGNASVTSQACDAPAGYVSNDDDCNDAAAAVNPGATEVCDSGVDNNCNGSSDDADGTLSLASRLTFYRDLDTDTYGNVAVTSLACAAPAGYVSNDDDCDDTNLNINPGEDEVCDPADVDEDCSLTADDADPGVTGTFTTFYRDVDGDTYGNAAVTDDRCDAGDGYVSNDDDCNDGAAAIKPGATEVCDSVDNDCDTLIDDADPGVSGSAVTYYRDADGDGQGTTTPTTTAVCAAPAGYAVTSTDCDDTRTAVYLGAPEICDSLDNDCDTLVDDADTLAGGAGTLTYMDDDLDDYGDELDASPVRYCVVPVDRATNNTDCDDSAAGVHPGEPEIEDGIDQDCDDYVDEGGVIGVESIRITEFMFNPDPFVDTDAEWIELYNPGTVDVVVGPGWRFTENGSSLTITALTAFVVPADGYALLVRSTNNTLNGGIPIVSAPQRQYAVWNSLALGNTGGGDTMTILYDDPDVAGGEVTIDVVTYLLASGGWPSSGTAAGKAIQLSNDGSTAPPTYPANNNVWASYCLATAAFGSQFGTPGAVNLDCTP
jgi:hypothetical protein